MVIGWNRVTLGGVERPWVYPPTHHWSFFAPILCGHGQANTASQTLLMLFWIMLKDSTSSCLTSQKVPMGTRILTLSDLRGVLFAQPSRVNWLLIFYGWEYWIQYLMVFQIEGICIAYNSQKKFSSSNFFGNLNFLKRSKYTPGPIGLKIWCLMD